MQWNHQGLICLIRCQNKIKKYMLQQLRKKAEEQRIQRLQEYENKAFNTYDKIHQRLLGR